MPFEEKAAQFLLKPAVLRKMRSDLRAADLIVRMADNTESTFIRFENSKLMC